MATTAQFPTSATFFSSTEQARAGITSGAYEIHVPAHDNRVYFAADTQQALCLLDNLIGLPRWKREEHLERLNAIARRGGGITNFPTRWEGEHGGTAFVAGTTHAPARKFPRFGINDRVRFYLESESYTVRGITLKYLPGEFRTSWQYHYAEGPELGWGVDESLARIGIAYQPQAETGYHRAVLAESGMVSLSHFNTRDAGPWQGMGRDEFRAAVGLIVTRAFAIRELR
jgi:hypothetical protein